jgi:hypothetical protein
MKLLLILFVSVMIVGLAGTTRAQTNASPADLRRLADESYKWRNQQYPVTSSDAALHTWDNKLTDYSPAAIAARRARITSLAVFERQ